MASMHSMFMHNGLGPYFSYIRSSVRLVATTIIQERHLFHLALTHDQVRLLFESGECGLG